MSQHNLLLVDDDPKSLRLLEVSLRRAGFRVVTAQSGLDALARMGMRPDALVVDAAMPDMDGFELCTLLRQDPQHEGIPVLMLLREQSLEDRARAMEQAAGDFVVRPVGGTEVARRVQLLLARRACARLARGEDLESVTGRLDDVGVPDLVSALDMGKRTGVLRLRRDSQEGAVWFRDGRVVDAQCGAARQERAFFRVLLWASGSFEFVAGEIGEEHLYITLGTQALLQEGLRRLVEWDRVREQLPPLRDVFEVNYHALAERLAEIPDEVNGVLRLFDGHRSMVRVAEDAPFDDLTSLNVIAKLFLEGLLVPRVAAMTVDEATQLDAWIARAPISAEAKAAAEQEARRVEEEAARKAAEEEAARIAAEEAARKAAEEETARIAAEEAARKAAEEETARVAALEAARKAADEAARLAAAEAARKAAEEEAARVAAAEAARKAAEEEAARVAAAEAARKVAEEEAARVAAEAARKTEEEAARVAAEAARKTEEEAARVAAEEAARKVADGEAARVAAEEAARKAKANEKMGHLIEFPRNKVRPEEPGAQEHEVVSEDGRALKARPVEAPAEPPRVEEPSVAPAATDPSTITLPDIAVPLTTPAPEAPVREAAQSLSVATAQDDHGWFDAAAAVHEGEEHPRSRGFWLWVGGGVAAAAIAAGVILAWPAGDDAAVPRGALEPSGKALASRLEGIPPEVLATPMSSPSSASVVATPSGPTTPSPVAAIAAANAQAKPAASPGAPSANVAAAPAQTPTATAAAGPAQPKRAVAAAKTPTKPEAGPRSAPTPEKAEPKVVALSELLKKGNALIKRGKHDAASKIFADAAKAHPNSAEAHYGLGRALYERGSEAASIPHLERAVRIKPSLAGAYVHLGSAYQLKQQAAKARRAYETYLKLAPRGAHAEELRGVLKGM